MRRPAAPALLVPERPKTVLAGGCLTRPAPARRPTSQEFSNTFSIGESTNKRTVMFKDNGLSTSVTRSKVHSSLDWGI